MVVCKNCVNCACGMVAVLQIIAKSTASSPRSDGDSGTVIVRLEVYCAIKVVTTTNLTWDKYVFWGHRAYRIVSLVEKEQLLQCMYTCTEWRNGNWWLSSAVLRGITSDSGRRRMQCFCMFVRSDSCPESSCLVLWVKPPEWPIWLRSSMSLKFAIQRE